MPGFKSLGALALLALPLGLAAPAAAEPDWLQPVVISISGHAGAALPPLQLGRGSLTVDRALLLDRPGADVMERVAGLLMAEALDVRRGGWSALVSRSALSSPFTPVGP